MAAVRSGGLSDTQPLGLGVTRTLMAHSTLSDSKFDLYYPNEKTFLEQVCEARDNIAAAAANIEQASSIPDKKVAQDTLGHHMRHLSDLINSRERTVRYPADRLVLFKSNALIYIANINTKENTKENTKNLLELLNSYVLVITWLDEYLAQKVSKEMGATLEHYIEHTEGAAGAISKVGSVVKHIIINMGEVAAASRSAYYFMHFISGIYRLREKIKAIKKKMSEDLAPLRKCILPPRKYLKSHFFSAFIQLIGTVVWGIACILLASTELAKAPLLHYILPSYSSVIGLLSKLGLGVLFASPASAVFVFVAVAICLDWVANQLVDFLLARKEYTELKVLDKHFSHGGNVGFLVIRDIKKAKYEENLDSFKHNGLLVIGMVMLAAHFFVAPIIATCLLGGAIVTLGAFSKKYIYKAAHYIYKTFESGTLCYPLRCENNLERSSTARAKAGMGIANESKGEAPRIAATGAAQYSVPIIGVSQATAQPFIFTGRRNGVEGDERKGPAAAVGLCSNG